MKPWLFLLVFFLIPLVSAVPSSDIYFKTYLTPFYVESLTNNANTTFYFYFNPESIGKIKSVIVNFQIYITPTVRFYLVVNETACNPPSYLIHTTYMDAGYADIAFDCTQVINKAGNYTIKLMPSGANTGAARGWVDIAYSSAPTSIQVFGTEYKGGEYGKTWIQLLNSQKQYINNATCLLTIYYPDGTKLFDNAYMDYLEKGIYYYDFIVPDMEGVYPITVECFYTTLQNIYTANSSQIAAGTQTQNTYIATKANDNIYWGITESGGTFDINLTFVNVTEPFGLSDIVYTWNGIWKKEEGDIAVDRVNFYAYNFTSNSWIKLYNEIMNYNNNEQTITNSIVTTNATSSGLLSNKQMKIRINDTKADSKNTKFRTDYFAVSLVGLTGGEYQEVKGSSEIHVSNGKGYYITSSCGNENYISCGKFTNDDEFQEAEGEIENNITVYSLVSSERTTTFTYETPPTIDCSAVYWIKRHNGTDWVDITSDVFRNSDIQKENCIITIPITLEKNGIYNYWVKMDNYLKWEVEWTKNLVDGMKDEIIQRCHEINSTHNYTVPIQEGTNIGTGETAFCHRAIDDIYWIDYYYNQSLNYDTVGDYISYLVEARFYRRALFDELNRLKKIDINLNNLNITANVNTTEIWSYPDRSLTNYSYWENQTSYLANLISQIPNLVWSFGNRTLTEFNFLVELSSSSINAILSPLFLRFDSVDANITALNNSISSQIYLVNQSLFNELSNHYLLLSGINESVISSNSSLSSQINSTKTELLSVLNQIENSIYNVNQSVYYINFSLSNQIDQVYSSMLEVNSTLQSLNVSINPSDIWNYQYRNLTYYPDFNYTAMSESVWSYQIRNLTYYPEYNDTLLKAKLDELNQTLFLINQTLLENISQELYNLNNIIQSDNYQLNQTIISSFMSLNQTMSDLANSIIQEINAKALTAKQIWEYEYRNLTYYPELNYTAIAEGVWNYENRTLTLYSNITKELEGIMSGLAYLNQTVDWLYQLNASSYQQYQNISSQINECYSLAQYMNNTLNEMNSTLYLVNSSVINEILNIPQVNYTLISENVWKYDNRTLTEFDFNMSSIYAVNQSLSDLINYQFNNTNGIIYALDNNMAFNFSYLQNNLQTLNSSVEYYISNSTNNLTAYIQNITIITAEDVWTYQVRELTTAVNVTAGNITSVQNVLNAQATFRDLRYAGGTEYSTGETGQVSYLFLDTLSGNPNPVINAQCNLTVWYPNKTKLVDNVQMTHLENGLYYYNIVMPTISGVYTSQAICSNQTIKGIGSSSFHVAPWANAIFYLDSNTSFLKNYLILKEAKTATNSYCISNNTLKMEYNITIEENGNSIPITKEEYYECSLGCKDDKCIPKSQLNIFVFLPALVIGLALLFMKNRMMIIIGGMLLMTLAAFLLTQGLEVSPLHLLGTSGSIILNSNSIYILSFALIGIALIKMAKAVFEMREG